MNKRVLCSFQTLRIEMLMMLSIYLFDLFKAGDPIRDNIDKCHFKQYPFCGSMRRNPKANIPTGRVVNSAPPEDPYPWAVLMLRENLQIDGPPNQSKCSGSVITDKYEYTTILK